MFLLKKILAAIILPPAGPLLLALFGLWLARRQPRSGQALTAIALGSLLLMSTPWFSRQLAAGIEDTPPVTAAALKQAGAIVILGGGSHHNAPEYGGDTVSDLTLARLRYGARLARASGLPVAVAGGAPWGGKPEGRAMSETLATDFGVTTRWIEGESRDTAENAALLAPMLKEAGIGRIALVTHAWHMPRARALFARQGLDVLPAPTGYTTVGPMSLHRWLPNAEALWASRLAINEWLGRLATRLAAAAAQ